jgi:hypothetical protein
MKNQMIISFIGYEPFFISNRLHRLLDQTERYCGTFASEQTIFLSLKIVIVHKEILKLIEKRVGKIFKAPDVRVHVVSFRHTSAHWGEGPIALMDQ